MASRASTTPDLEGHLVCTWRGDLGAMRLPLPDECLDLVWVDDGSIWLSGPETRSWSRGYPPGTAAVGVRFRPGSGRPTSVRDLRRMVGLSERQIHRRCTAAFGYGPAVLVRILRLHRVLELARAHERPPGLADLAATAGYFDQQHLSHEVRTIVGTTPGTLLAAPDVRSVHDVAA